MPVHRREIRNDSTTEERAGRTAISAVGAHAVRLSSAVCEACSNLTVVAYWCRMCRVAVSGMLLLAQQVCSEERCGSQPNSNFGSSNCSCIHCRALMWLRGSVASPRRECAREANWTEERQQEVQWGALLSKGLFRRDMVPVVGCALESVILLYSQPGCIAADTYTRHHHPKQPAGGEFTAALHTHESSCCPTTLLLAQHSTGAC